MPTLVQLDLAPDVVVRVFGHALGPVTCFSYVTHGLARFGQAELVFTLRRRPRPRVERTASAAAYGRRVAARGQLVGDAGFTQFGPGGLFGRPHLRGVAYRR